jgi:hypothetical protein
MTAYRIIDWINQNRIVNTFLSFDPEKWYTFPGTGEMPDIKLYTRAGFHPFHISSLKNAGISQGTAGGDRHCPLHHFTSALHFILL